MSNSSASSTGSVDLHRVGSVAVLTINRPNKLNAFTLEMVRELMAQVRRLADDPDTRAIVLTGAGDRAFCCGGDLRSLLPAIVGAGADLINPDPTKRFFSDVYVPIISAVRGLCLGGGLELMLGTDLRVASSDARFAVGEVTWGLIPGAGTHVRLPRQIPWAIAMQLLLLGDPIDAQRAYEVGLVNEVVAPEQVLPRALELASRLADNGPLAVRTAKEIAVRALALEDGFTVEHALNVRVLASEDAHEGPAAFVAGRPPTFQGR